MSNPICSRGGNERIYPCAKCGTMRTKAEGGTCFTVCDDCWDKLHPTPAPTPDPCKKNDPVFLTNDPAPTPRTFLVGEYEDIKEVVLASEHQAALAAKDREIEWLELNNAMLTDDPSKHKEYSEVIAELRATLLAREGELDSMSAALAAAQEDKERLDWLEKRGMCFRGADNLHAMTGDKRWQGWVIGNETEWAYSDARAAIDAAREGTE